MKLFSWNVNGIRAVVRKNEWQKFMDKYKPDIIGLQEIKANKDQIIFDTDDSYFKYYNSAERPGYAGTAIFSKIEPLQVIFDIPEEIARKYNLQDKYGYPNKEGRVLTAEYEKFYFVTVYTPNSKGDLSRLDLRQKWDEVFLEYIKFLEQTKPVIFCGDLNVAHKEIDLANPKGNRGKHGFTDEERSGFDKIVKSELIDTFREFHPEPNQYSWWSNFAKSRERNAGWRIDYFVASKSLLKNIKDSKIHQSQMGSDHCPIELELDF